MIIGFFAELDSEQVMGLNQLRAIRAALNLYGIPFYESPDITQLPCIEGSDGVVRTLEEVECWLENK